MPTVSYIELQKLREKLAKNWKAIVRRKRAAVREAKLSTPVPLCPHRSAEPIGTVDCSCADSRTTAVYGCAIHEFCTLQTVMRPRWARSEFKNGAHVCRGCENNPSERQP